MTWQVQWAWVILLFYSESALFVLFYDIQYFMIEQIIENAICRANNYVAKMNFTGVLVSQLWSILANIVLALFEDLSQLNAFLDLSFLLEQLNVFFPGQDRELVWCVKWVHLFFWTRIKVSFAYYLSIVWDTAVLLAVVNEPTVTQVGETQLRLVKHANQSGGATDCSHALKSLLENIERIQIFDFLIYLSGLSHLSNLSAWCFIIWFV